MAQRSCRKFSNHISDLVSLSDSLQFDNLEEHRGPIRLTIKGSVPSWAAGSLFRTGPGQSCIKDTSRGTHYVSHWFDGFAQTHRFDIVTSQGNDNDETEVWYSSRRQADDWVEHIKKTGWRSGMTFGQKADPCIGLFSKFMSTFEPKFANNNVVVIPNIPGLPGDDSKEASQEPTALPLGHRPSPSSLYITTDYAGLRRIDPSTLEPIGEAMQDTLHPSLAGVCSCAHAQRDPVTGDMFNYNLQFGKVPTYRIFRVSAGSGKTDILATVKLAGLSPAYMHSFFLTENYVALCIPSSHYAWMGVKIPYERNLLDAMLPFDQQKTCKWLVVDRTHGKGLVATFSTPAGFFFHSVNAFEEVVKDKDGDRTDLCLDAIWYENLDVMKGFYYDIILDRNGATKKHWVDGGRCESSNPGLVRYRFTIPSSLDQSFPPAATKDFTIKNPHAGELPSIHPGHVSRPYRFAYSAPLRGLSTIVDALAKTDVTTGETLIWGGPAGHTPGEPIFVPRPGGEEEDDGVVMSVVVDGQKEVSYLLCLDGRTMEEVGRAEAEFAIGMGFHGVHMPMEPKPRR